MKGATAHVKEIEWTTGISIHTPYEGSDLTDAFYCEGHKISIHTPYEGSDLASIRYAVARYDFNPHSL